MLAGDCTIAEAAIRHLGALPGKAEYLTEHFSPAGGPGRLFFTVENAMRADAARSEIRRWFDAGLISEVEEAFLLASLIEAADQVANTAGTYLAHLKTFTRKALKPIRLTVPPITDNRLRNICNRMDARDLSACTQADVLYLDPPYNQRDYAAYYHLPETLARGDAPSPAGKSGAPRPPREKRSDFCSPPRAVGALKEVVRRAQSRYIIVHYAADGLIGSTEIMNILQARGPTTFQDFRVRAYSATKGGGPSVATHRIYWCECQGSA
jgi:adenine-specific DNA-methyltransferase